MTQCPSIAADRVAAATRLVDRYAGVVGDPDAMLHALLRPLPQTLWANTLRISREALVTLLADDGIGASPVRWWREGLRLSDGARPGLHWGFLAGLFQVQEEAAMVPVRCLEPRPGERILDLCAAPGNKTAQIAVAMGNRGTVVANDRSRGRIAAIRQSIKRLGLVNVSVTVRDGQGMDHRCGTFDRVLVDAPCTCEGTFRKSSLPRVADREQRGRAAALQQRLLERAVRLVRPGGRIVYSTCTFSPEENETVVDAVLRMFPGELRVSPVCLPGLIHSPGLQQWGQARYAGELAGAARIWPHQNDSGGFFVAVLERRGAPDPGPTADSFHPVPESSDWLRPFGERFGIPQERLEGMLPVRRGGRHVHLLAQDHQAPRAPAPEMLGLPAVRRKSLPLKPTTAAMMLLGGYATRNVVELDRDQLDAYLCRRTSVLAPAQKAGCDGPGYAVVRFRGFPVGVGQLIYDRSSPTVWLTSLMPKAWQPPGRGALPEPGSAGQGRGAGETET